MALELDLTTTDPVQRLMKRVVELEHRVRDLERQRFAVPVNPTNPTTLEGALGSMAGDYGGNRLFVHLPSGWYYTPLTVFAP